MNVTANIEALRKHYAILAPEQKEVLLSMNRREEKARRNVNRMRSSAQIRNERQSFLRNVDPHVSRRRRPDPEDHAPPAPRARKIRPANPNAPRIHGKRESDRRKTSVIADRRLVEDQRDPFTQDTKSSIENRGGHAPRAGRSRRQRREKHVVEEKVPEQSAIAFTETMLARKAHKAQNKAARRRARRVGHVQAGIPDKYANPSIPTPSSGDIHTESVRDVSLNSFLVAFDNIFEGPVKTGSLMITFLYQIYRSRSVTDQGVAVYQFYHALGSHYEIRDTLEIWLQTMKEYFSLPQSQDYEIEMNEIRAESWREDFSRVQVFLESFLDSVIFESLNSLLRTLVKAKFLPRDISVKLNNLFYTAKRVSVYAGLRDILDSIKTLWEFSLCLYRGSDISQFMRSSNPLGEWLVDSQRIVLEEDYTYSGLPIEGMRDHITYKTELQNLLTQGREIEKVISKTDAQYSTFQRRYFELIRISRAIKLNDSSRRPQPIGVELVGPPGIGKSKIQDFILMIFSNVKGRTHSDNLTFHRDMGDKFFEGYDPWQHPYIHYAELGHLAPAAALNRDDPYIYEVQTLLDSNPKFVPQAFDNKGKVKARPELLIIDTNNEDLNLTTTHYCPAAILRRLVVVRQSVLPAFKKDGSTAIDPEKSEKAGGNRLDRYSFDVLRKNPDGDLNYVEEYYLQGGNIDRLEAVLRELFIQHISVAERELRDELDMQQNYFAESSDSEDEKKYPIDPQCEDIFVESYSENVIGVVNWVYELTAEVSSACVHYLITFLLLFLLSTHAKGEINNLYGVLLVLAAVLPSYAWIIVLLILMLAMFFKYFPIYVAQQAGGNIQLYFRLRLEYYAMRLYYLFGLGPMRFISNNKQIMGQIAAITAAISFLTYIYTSNKKGKKPIIPPISSQKMSEFRTHSVVNSSLTHMEEQLGISEHRPRLKRMDTVWNVACNEIPLLPRHTGTSRDLAATLMNNIRRVRVISPSNEASRTYIFGVKGSLALINRHVVPLNKVYKLQVATCDDALMAGHYREFDIDFANAVIVSADLVLFDIININFKDATKHTLPEMARGNYSGCLGKNPVRASLVRDLNMSSGHDTIHLEFGYEYELEGHVPGICGIPLFLDTQNGTFLAGIHSGGAVRTDFAYSSLLLKDELDAAISDIIAKSPFVPNHSRPDVHPEHFVEEPVRKSPFNYEVLPNLENWKARFL